MIETERLNLKILERQHLEPLREMRNDPSTWHWLTDVVFISEKDQEKWFEGLQGDRLRLYLAIEDKEENLVGIIRSDAWDRINRSIRVGCDIAKEYRCKGYGTEALGSFVDHLFKHQNLHRVWLLVVEANEVAKHIYEKLGFKEEGKQRDAIYRDGKYQDYISMSLLEDEYFESLKNEKNQIVTK